jgi:predicted dehydrogenase
MAKKLKVGIVGTGHIVQHRHLDVLKKLKNIDVTAICDLREDVAKSVAAKFGVKNYYTNFSDMLKQGLDIVDICTPPKTHFSMSIEALEAGANVLVEKPMAMTVEQVDEMYKISRKMNLKLCVVHQNHFNQIVQKAKQMVDDGLVGDLLCVEVSTMNRRINPFVLDSTHWSHKLPGGMFGELLPHPVYTMQIFLKNLTPKYVVAKKLGNYSWMNFDEMRALLDSDSAIGYLIGSCNSAYDGDFLNIFGTKLTLQVDLYGRFLIKNKPKDESPYQTGKNNLSLASQSLGILGKTIVSTAKMATSGIEISAHYGFIKAFVDSIQNSTDPPVGEQEAKENIQIMDSVCSMIDSNLPSKNK